MNCHARKVLLAALCIGTFLHARAATAADAVLDKAPSPTAVSGTMPAWFAPKTASAATIIQPLGGYCPRKSPPIRQVQLRMPGEAPICKQAGEACFSGTECCIGLYCKYEENRSYGHCASW